MTIFQLVNSDGEIMSSAFAEIDRANPAIYCDCSVEPSLTRQEFAEDCDINTLMAQYEKTGVINHFNNATPQYLDLSEIPDLQTSLDFIAEANAAFMRLPATVRREFDNDPVKFVEFGSNPENIEKMREWGLTEPEPQIDPPQRVEIVNPASPVDKTVNPEP